MHNKFLVALLVTAAATVAADAYAKKPLATTPAAAAKAPPLHAAPAAAFDATFPASLAA